MNKLLGFISLLSNFAVAQKPMSCEKGTQRAIQDFKNGTYILQTLGLLHQPFRAKKGTKKRYRGQHPGASGPASKSLRY